MPKVLIKEYDNSITSIPATDNFAVVVPGYFGTPRVKDTETGERYNPDDLLIDYGVYEIKSQSDFKNYIGKVGGLQQADGEGPTLLPINNTGTNEYTKYYRYLRINDFYDENRTVYEIEHEIYSTDHPHGDLYGKNGHLLKTITYTQVTNIVDENGEITGTESSQVTVTIKLRPVTINEVEFRLDETTRIQHTISDKYCIINKGYEGTDKFDTPQMGNQIAYELLGLGYTVLYKKLDPNLGIDQLGEADFWAPLKDKSIFNFRYIMTGGYYNVAAMNEIVKLATFINENASLEDSETLVGKENGRGDCIALCDLDEKTYSINAGLSVRDLATNIGLAAGVIEESPYAAIFAPRVTYIMADDDDFAYTDEVTGVSKTNKTFPASFHYLACAAKAFSKYNEWYAVAGYNRGVSKFDVANTSIKIGEILINTLAPRVENTYTRKSINLILHERGNYFIWGNRTAARLNKKGLEFKHFLNIRQLCCSIKKQLYTACRQFTFDPNSDILWINFVNAIKPTLEAMKADQGIKGYTITRVIPETKKAVLTARIRIVPIEAVEDFDISIYLEDSITGLIVKADESQA
jgi:hypothetical protein